VNVSAGHRLHPRFDRQAGPLRPRYRSPAGGVATFRRSICFAHVAYRLRERFLALATAIESFEVRYGPALEQRIGEADVLVVSVLVVQRSLAAREAGRASSSQSVPAPTSFSREALNCGVFATG
jgi:hypothetical protein